MNPAEIRLLDPAFYAGDPYPTYRWLRENSPVHWDAQHEVWGISRFADVLAIEKNPRRYSSAQGSRPRVAGDSAMINTDDPHHNDRRRLISPRFTPRDARKHEAAVRGRVTGLIDEVIEQGRCDVVRALAAPLPSMVITEWLGFPHERWSDVKRWSEVTMLAGGTHDPETGAMVFDNVEGAMRAVQEFSELTLEIAAKRRSQPKDDLISAWVHAEPEGGKLTDAELVSEALLVQNGGAETTRAVIGQTVVNLIEHPEQRQKLIDDPSPEHMRVAVEEFVRWVSPVLNMRRTVVETHELHGQTLREGDELLLMYPSANRDPAQFDDPDVYDVEREKNQHAAFGWGTHFCVGASVARLELRLMFEELMKRIPDMRLAPGAELQFFPSCFARAYGVVDVEFTPGARS
ncbi:MAG: cytochrome P450 [Deltaproteobacteria bacterium]|nr:cytochrome P450 [Deltaproteobacteria bacterium]